MSDPGVRPSDAYRLLGEELKFQGKLVAVTVEHFILPSGREARHERIHLPAAVAILPLLVEAGRRPEVVLVEQFRGSVRGYIHEVPAGVVEEGEDPAACARRELEEETGYVAGRFRPLATLCPIPGTSAHRMYFYLAEDLAPGRQRLEEAECLTVKRVPLDDLVAAILDGPSSGTDTGKSPGAGAAPGALPGEADAPAAGRVVVIDAKTHLAVLHVALLRRGAGA